jgi:hypothetical protein
MKDSDAILRLIRLVELAINETQANPTRTPDAGKLVARFLANEILDVREAPNPRRQP